jgi:hypothetical protein
MKSTHITVFFILVFSLTSCVKSEEPESKPTYSIMVNNKTNNSLLVFYQLNYPDTSLQKIKPDLTMVQQRSYGLIVSETKWDDLIKQNNDQMLWIFFLAGGTFEKYSWDTVRSQYIILKRMNFSLDSLQKLNWIVQYP